jgi:hypothetical protein
LLAVGVAWFSAVKEVVKKRSHAFTWEPRVGVRFLSYLPILLSDSGLGLSDSSSYRHFFLVRNGGCDQSGNYRRHWNYCCYNCLMARSLASFCIYICGTIPEVAFEDADSDVLG